MGEVKELNQFDHIIMKTAVLNMLPGFRNIFITYFG